METETGWCSWCFISCPHALTESRFLRRSSYTCTHCKGNTLPCRKTCGAFARAFPTWDEELCAACDGRFDGVSWESGEAGLHEEVGWCSWCFDDTRHFLYSKNVLSRDWFSCRSCRQRTVRCTICSDAFAKSRDSGGVPSETALTVRTDDKACAKCGGVVRAWGRVAAVDFWCSACCQATRTTSMSLSILSETDVCNHCGASVKQFDNDLTLIDFDSCPKCVDGLSQTDDPCLRCQKTVEWPQLAHDVAVSSPQARSPSRAHLRALLLRVVPPSPPYTRSKPRASSSPTTSPRAMLSSPRTPPRRASSSSFQFNPPPLLNSLSLSPLC